MQDKNVYIWLTLAAGLIVPWSAQQIALITLGILHVPYDPFAYAWLSLPFVYLSIYLAMKKSRWDLKQFKAMWRIALLTAFIIYVYIGLEIEMHELEGRRISGKNFSPRNVLTFFLLPFLTICCMWLVMLLERMLGVITHRISTLWHELKV